MLGLVELTEVDELKKLRDLYRQDWPKYCVGYNCLNNFLKWKKKNSNIKNLIVYSSPCEEGLYIVIDRYQLFLGSLNKDNCENLTKALMSLDWSKGFKVSSFLECHRPAVLSTVKTKTLDIEYDSMTLEYYLPNAEARLLDIRIPDSLHLRSLSFKDSNIVNDVWYSRRDGSLEFLQTLIEYNVSLGLYTKDSSELVAWCTRCQCGFLGTLHVKDQYRGQGLAMILVEVFSQKITQLGEEVRTVINDDNLPSRKLFCKLGFKSQEDVFIIYTKP